MSVCPEHNSAPDVGTTVGQHHFTNLTYADDAAIFMSDVTQAVVLFGHLTPSHIHWVSEYHGLRRNFRTWALAIRRLHSLWMGHLSKV